MNCDVCDGEFFPGDTGWNSCSDCFAGHVEWLLTGGLAKAERKPLRRARPPDDDELTIIVQPLPRAA